MVNRNELTGAIALGAKPDGGSWRPDEIELIAAAALQSGRDLDALELKRLQHAAASLHQEIALLRGLRLAPMPS